jgi:AAA ATPase domain
MELLERQATLADLARLARQGGDGQGGIVLLCGEAGVGKTALLERLQRDLPGPHQRGDRGAALHLGQNRRSSCLRRAFEARRPHPRRRRDTPPVTGVAEEN